MQFGLMPGKRTIDDVFIVGKLEKEILRNERDVHVILLSASGI